MYIKLNPTEEFFSQKNKIWCGIGKMSEGQKAQTSSWKINIWDVIMYNMVNIVNNTVLNIWKLLRVDSKVFITKKWLIMEKIILELLIKKENILRRNLERIFLIFVYLGINQSS